MSTAQESASELVVASLSRDLILDTTEHSLSEVGYEATTIRHIAGRLGCAVGSIYRYFQDKRDLLTAAGERVLEPVAAKAEAGVPLAQSVCDYDQVARRHRELYSLMFWLAAAQHAAANGNGGGGGGRATPPEVVQRILDAWSHPAGGPAAARRLWSLLHGAVLLDLPYQALDLELPGESAPSAPNPSEPRDTRHDDITLL